jgi:predicted Zn-dependent peptidase
MLDEDFIKFDVLDNILTAGRSSRLNNRMVIKDKSALGIFSMAGFPGSKYPGLYLFFALPNSDHTNSELIAVMNSEIEKIKKESVTPEELESAKTRVKVNLIREMQSNQGLLMEMLRSEVIKGSWKKAFDEIQAIEKITPDDIRELVKKYLIVSGRSIGKIEKKQKEEAQQ